MQIDFDFVMCSEFSVWKGQTCGFQGTPSDYALASADILLNRKPNSQDRSSSSTSRNICTRGPTVRTGQPEQNFNSQRGAYSLTAHTIIIFTLNEEGLTRVCMTDRFQVACGSHRMYSESCRVKMCSKTSHTPATLNSKTIPNSGISYVP